MLRDEPADERQQVAEVPRVKRTDAGNPRLAELENREAPARPQHARDLTQRALRFRHIANAEPNRRGIARAVAERDLCSVAANEPDPAIERGRPHLHQPKFQHLAGEIHADDRRAVRATYRRDCQIAGAGAQVQHPGVLSERQCVHGDLTPAAIQPGAEHVVQQVVPRRNRVEHARDTRWGLIGWSQGHARKG